MRKGMEGNRRERKGYGQCMERKEKKKKKRERETDHVRVYVCGRTL